MEDLCGQSKDISEFVLKEGWRDIPISDYANVI